MLVVAGVELCGVKGGPIGLVGGELVGHTVAAKSRDEPSGTGAVAEVGVKVGDLAVVPAEPKVAVGFLVVGQVGQHSGLRKCGP